MTSKYSVSPKLLVISSKALRFSFLVSMALVLMFSVSQAQLFGNGSDGSLTVTTTIHLGSDMNYTDLTVGAAGTIETHGYTIYVSGTLINNGTITDSYSGGTGGNGGTPGLGGQGHSPHVSASSGGNGMSGSVASVSGGGDGGRGGGGGGGGGGAWDITRNEAAEGGKGGSGGLGGQGGGAVLINTLNLDNTSGVIHADGFTGGTSYFGLPGTEETYFSFPSNYDLAGGGGGGGGGGQGGFGGTVKIVYGNLTSGGTFRADGGSGGAGASGGTGIGTSYATVNGQFEENGAVGGTLSSAGGSGGRGERDGVGSSFGNGGVFGPDGGPGTVSVSAAVLCFIDTDNDGYGNAGDAGTWTAGGCAIGYISNNFDCNDFNGSIHPGATDVPGDGVDQNCDGFDACYSDNDGDGYGGFTVITGVDLTCTAVGESPNNFDCADNDASVNPGATEIVADGIDQNCDGMEECYVDADADGFGSASTVLSANLACASPGVSSNSGDCDDSDANVNPGMPETQCDGLDNDCYVGTPDEVDNDGDGISACTDCDDNNPNMFPGNPEISCDGLDNDCDGGTPDEIDNDGDGVSACTDCDDNNGQVFPGNAEITCDGLDNDCDGGTPDEVDNDGDGVSACTDCDDNNGQVFPGNAEITCDGFDNDCDGGTPDEVDSDGDGVSACLDCNDSNPNMYPGNTEITCDGLDNDCDGGTPDEVDNDGDTFSACTDCDDSDATIYPGAPEILDDGIDQDCDGSDATCCGLYTTGQTGNADCSVDGKRNLADITRLIDRVYISKLDLCCELNGNIDGDFAAKINLADITNLIDHVYISKLETAPCN